MKRAFLFLIILLVSCQLFASSSSAAYTFDNQPMQYITKDDFYSLLFQEEDYLLLDLRRIEDYSQEHILGAVSADMDKAMNGDYDDGVRVMKQVLLAETGAENGNGKRIILACYTGNRYAQAATNVLGMIEADLSQVYTLKGGNTEWNASIYKCLVTKEIGKPNRTIIDEFALGLQNGGQEETIDEDNRLATKKTVDKNLLSMFDFSYLHGSSAMNLEIILDLFSVHTPCAFESLALTEGFSAGYEGADIFLEHNETGERALRHRDGSTTVYYQNGSVGTVLLALPKNLSSSRIHTFDEKKMKIAYVAIDDDLMAVVFTKVNFDYALSYGESLGGDMERLEKGILVRNEKEAFTYISTPELTAIILY